MLTDEVINIALDYPIKDEYNRVVLQKDPKLLEKVVDLINQTFFTEDYDISMKIKSYHQTKEAIQELHNKTQNISMSDFILGFVVKSNKSTDLKEIALIEKIRVQCATYSVTLSKSEIDKLKDLIIESDMLSMFKSQIIEKLDESIANLINKVSSLQ